MNFELKPHPNVPVTLTLSIEVEVARTHEGDFVLRYTVAGEIAQILLPKPVQYSSRHENLWQHTCFEAFVAPDDGRVTYVEFNFAPSTGWDAYRFDDYRKQGDTMSFPAPHFDVERSSDRLEVVVALDVSEVAELPASATWHLGLTAVIEAKDGTRSYWALAHAPGPPDFHNPACFVATLPAPDGP